MLRADVEKALDEQEKRAALLSDLESLIKVQKEATKRQIRRLDRAHSAIVAGDVVEAVNAPGWETRTRNVALIAACASVISAYK